MARRGRKRQLDVEDRYWQLLLAGVGTVEACRQVGIGRKTGYRWRAENGGVPPVRLVDTVRSNRYLSRLERQRIATLRGQGLGVREIARRMDRSPSTISRELRRNLSPHDHDRYDADLAHARAQQRAAVANSFAIDSRDLLTSASEGMAELPAGAANAAAFAENRTAGGDHESSQASTNEPKAVRSLRCRARLGTRTVGLVDIIERFVRPCDHWHRR